MYQFIIAYCMSNIYYVGRRNPSELQRNSSAFLPIKTIPHSNSNPPRTASASNSRKIEPKYAAIMPLQESHSLKRNKNYTYNSQHFSPRVDRTYRVAIKSQQHQQSSLQEQCSAISMQSMQFKFKFNKVRQPNMPRETPILTRRKDNEVKLKNHPKCEQAQLQTSKQTQPEGYLSRLRQMANAIPQQSQSQYSELCLMYKVQPKRKLFLCDSCLFYRPYIQIKSHYMQCNPPAKYGDYLCRWQALTHLLQEIYRMHPSNELFRMIELMDAYPNARRIRQVAPAIYSEQLDRILKFKGLMSLEEVKVEQLFEVIERVGDGLEVAKGNHTNWLLCS